jgi:hypothetical protein
MVNLWITIKHLFKKNEHIHKVIHENKQFIHILWIKLVFDESFFYTLYVKTLIVSYIFSI